MPAGDIDWAYVDALIGRLRCAQGRFGLAGLAALRPQTLRFALAVRRIADRGDAEIEAASAAALPRLLAHACERVPFYRGLFTSGTPGLEDFPVLRRSDLRTDFASLIARRGHVIGSVGDGAFYITRTSGSTGTAVSHLKRHADEFAWDGALLRRVYRAHRVPMHGSILDCGLRDPLDPLMSLRLVPGAFVTWNLRPFRLESAGAKEEYLAILSRVRPTVVHGAPSRVCEFIDVASSFARAMPRPRLVTLTYEELRPEAARRIADALGCRPVSLYGTSELGFCAWQCAVGSFHFPRDATRVEVITPTGPAAPGSVGSLVVTSLKSWTMPLIRYDTGDLARRPRSRTCGCGAADQFVDRLEGRGDIRLRDARGKLYLTYEPLSILDTCGIADFQIVQRVPGQVRIVLPAGSTTSEDRRDRAEARLHEYFNHAMDVEFAASGGFVLTASGKRNAVVAESVTHP